MSETGNTLSQDDVLKFMDDPETIKRAVEGSMEKRLKVLEEAQPSEAGDA